MKIILAAVEKSLADAWEKHCGDLPGVSIHRGSILDLAVDAVVSPANSFGFMDGGVDNLYTSHFGRGVQQRLQTLIHDRHHGELVVGAAEIVETGDTKIPFLIAAPTMRVPMILRDSVHPYLATRATFLLIQHGIVPAGPFESQKVSDLVSTVAFPGLGTGVGRVEPNTCARQMRVAIQEIALGKRTFPDSWADASTRHQLLYSDRVRNLQYD